MNPKAIVLTVSVFLLIVIGMFIFAYLQTDTAAVTNETTQTETADTTTNDRYAMIDRIDAKHYYIDGMHTIVGDVQLPTPCDLLEARAVTASVPSSETTIVFSVINNAETCIQQLTTARFSVQSDAPADAQFSATFMGRPVILNLIEAAPGERPEEFELYLKG